MYSKPTTDIERERERELHANTRKKKAMEKKKDNNIIQPMVIRCNSPDMMILEAVEIPNFPLSLDVSLCVPLFSS